MSFDAGTCDVAFTREDPVEPDWVYKGKDGEILLSLFKRMVASGRYAQISWGDDFAVLEVSLRVKISKAEQHAFERLNYEIIGVL